ncbi:MAG: Ig-like domain-containing protein [bacterium]
MVRVIRVAAGLVLLALSCPLSLRVSIIEPRGGTLVRGSTTVRARASGPNPVVSVELLADGRSFGVESTAAGGVYTFAFNSAALLPDTIAELVCVARDAAGATATSAPVRVRVYPGTRHSDEIDRATTWTESGNPHIVEGELYVRARLRIEAGVEVLFEHGAAITVGLGLPGALQASGLPGRPVRFGSLSRVPAAGDWRGLGFHPAAGPDSSWLRNCVIEYGRDLVYSDVARLVVESCTLRHALRFGAVAESTGFARFSANFVTACDLPVRVGPAWTDRLAPDNVFSGNRRDAAGITGGDLREPLTWERQAWAWALLGPVTVAGPAAPTLVIAPGCSVLLADSAGIRVGVGLPGALRVVGEGVPVVLAPLDTAGWPGIELWPAADPLRTALGNCVISGAGRGASAALLVLAPATVTDVTITGSRSTGVRCSGAGFNQFARNTITAGAGIPLSIEAGWLGTIGPDNRFDGNARDTVEVRPGRVNRTSQWRNLGVPYRVTGLVMVGGDAAPILVIDGGVRLVFDRESGLEVGRDSLGRLSATSSGDSITFTGTEAVPGSWQGITLDRYAGSQSRLERCRLLYGGYSHPGILHVRQSAPVIANCEIGWSFGHCVVLTSSTLDPDDLLDANWIHDPAPNHDEIYEEDPGPGR